MLKIFILSLVLFVGSTGCSTKLPSREPAKVLRQLKALGAFPQIAAIEKILGDFDSDHGGGCHMYTYFLSDTSTIVVASVDGKTAVWIYRMSPGKAWETIWGSPENVTPY